MDMDRHGSFTDCENRYRYFSWEPQDQPEKAIRGAFSKKIILALPS